MAVRNIKVITPTVWIPPSFSTTYKITITRLDGTVDDVTDNLLSWWFEDLATQGIGSFQLVLPNPSESLNGLYTGMEQVTYYKDYATIATTQKFLGRIEKASNNQNRLTITGRDETLFAFEDEVNQIYTNVDLGFFVYDLFTKYGGGRYDLSQINQSTGLFVSETLSRKNFWEAIKEACNGNGYDCYVNGYAIVQFYATGSVSNTTDAIVHENNLVEVGEFAPDTTYIKNKITVIGADSNGVQPTQTVQDAPSQAIYGVRPLTIQDNNIGTDDFALAVAQYQLNYNLAPPIVGTVKCILLAGVNPAENVQISAPYDNLPAGFYQVIKYRDEYDNESGGPFTTVTINREQRTLSHVAKDLYAASSGQQQTSNNPYGLENSYTTTYLVETGVHSNTAIMSGVLTLATGQTSGTWTSISKSLSANITQVYINIDGQTLTGATISVSGDDGINYQTVTPQTLAAIVNQGTALKFKIAFSNTNTQVIGITILYTTST